MVPVHTTVIGYRCLLETDTGKIYEKAIYEETFLEDGGVSGTHGSNIGRQ